MIRLILFAAILILINPTSILSQENTELFLDGITISGIAQEEGFLWISTYGHGIFKYSFKDDKWSSYSTKQGNIDNDLFGNIAVSKNYVWAGSNEGLFILDKKKDQWRKRKFGLGGEFGNWVRSLKYDPVSDELWVGRFRYLTKLDVSRQRFTDHDLTQNNSQQTNNIISIGLDGDSLVWFGTENGVHKYDKRKKIDDKNAWEYISNKRGFQGDGDAVSVPAILVEGDNVWFGTDEFITMQMPQFNLGGIYRYNRKLRWDKISIQSGLPANGIYSLARTGNKIWAGLYSFDKKEKKPYGKGLVIIDRFTGVSTPVNLNETKLKTASILCMHFDGSDMWIGSNRGLLKIPISNPLASLDKPKKKVETKQPSRK
jgi:ligand-binding sensor domain-containing protein